jgi:3-hydroxyisobutyrate dehydrogenase-like beta-hydroxyacid dehydrogenase
MGKRIVHVGDLGNAKLVKNATAMLSAIEHLALAEIFQWLRQGGVSEETFLTVLRNSLNHSEGRERTAQAMVSRKFKPRKSWMPKDVGFGLEMGKAMEVPMPLTALAYQLFSVARANGLDGFEATGIAHYVYELLYGHSEAIQTVKAPK